MRRVGIYEAKTHLSALLRDVAKGERILITHRGEDVAEIIAPRTDAARAIGNLLGNEMPLGLPIREAIEEGRR